MSKYESMSVAELLATAGHDHDPEIQFQISRHFHCGTGGVQKNENESVMYLKRAGELGHKEAQIDLHMIYLLGMCGIPQNESEALKWAIKAAKQGSRLAEDHVIRRCGWDWKARVKDDMIP